MATTVTVPDKPVISVNASVVGNIEVKDGDQSFTSNRTATSVASPASVTMTGPAGATIRYTFNGKKVNLGSAVYSEPIVIRKNGNGFSSDNTVIRAKSYLNGDVSGTAEVVVALPEI